MQQVVLSGGIRLFVSTQVFSAAEEFIQKNDASLSASSQLATEATRIALSVKSTGVLERVLVVIVGAGTSGTLMCQDGECQLHLQEVLRKLPTVTHLENLVLVSDLPREDIAGSIEQVGFGFNRVFHAPDKDQPPCLLT